MTAIMTAVGARFTSALPDAGARPLQIMGAMLSAVGVTAPFGALTAERLTALPLSEGEQRFGELLRQVEMAAIMLDVEGRIVFCNDYLLELTGWRHEQVMGQNYFELFLHSEREVARAFIAKLLAEAPAKWHRENTIFTRSGEPRHMRWSNLLLRSPAGTAIGTASIGEDITERRHAEFRITYLNRVYAVLSRINSLIVRVRHRDDLFAETCRIVVESGGFPLAMLGILEPSARKIVSVALEGKDAAVVTAVKALLARTGGAVNSMVEQAIREKQPVIANDSQHDPRVAFRERHVEFGIHSMVILPLLVADEVTGVLALYASEPQSFHAEEMKLLQELAGNVAFAIDHIEKRERADYLAYYDALTGLANRTLFMDRLTQYLRSSAAGGRQAALLLLDLERFKSINDTLGRPAGDALLQQVADWLKSTIGDDSLLTRISADQFGVVVPDVTQVDDVARNIELMMESFQSRPFQIAGAQFRVAAKVGVAVFPDDAADSDALFEHAEAALKNAKDSGDRYLFYARRMSATVAARLTLENQLRQALERDELTLQYQPRRSLATGRVAGVEALIRWNDPATGLVLPAQLLPILEETGLIHELGQWAIRRAIQDYLRWCDAGLQAVRITVNVSPLQLRHRAFIPELERAIGVDARAAAGLELGFTEKTVMQNDQQNVAQLQAIHALGLGITIDDFGAGMSSLSTLASLPVDTIKISSSLVSSMDSGPVGLALVSTIIGLTHALKLLVIANGVDSEVQSRLLKLLRCDQIQGEVVGKPLTAETLEATCLAPPTNAAACGL